MTQRATESDIHVTTTQTSGIGMSQSLLPRCAAPSRRLARPIHAAAIAMFILTCGFNATACAGEPERIAVSYLLAPAKPLPERIRTVAVIDAGVESDEEHRGSREQKWQNIAADMIEAMIQSGSMDSVPGTVKVVDRRATKQILAEKDMQLVGIVEGDSAAAAAKLLAVDALIMSRVKIHIDYRRTKKTQIDWIGVLGGGGQGGRRTPARSPYHRGPNNPYRNRPTGQRSGPEIPRKTIEEVSRDLTVQCSFSLIDAGTGEALVRFSPPVYQKRDKAKPSFMYGGRVDAADLDPVDHFIGELVEQASREFVSMIGPVRASYIYPVELRGRDSEPAIRQLRADDFDGALKTLEGAFQRKPRESDYLFGMGLICEIRGDRSQALEIYRRLVSAKKVDEDKLDTYMAAKDRLTAHLNRIIVDSSHQPGGGLVTDNGGSREEKGGDDRRHRSRDGDNDDRRKNHDKDDDDDDDD